MTGGEGVIRRRRGGSGRWAAGAAALALHVALLVAVYRLAPAEVVAPMVERLIPVTLERPQLRPPSPSPRTQPRAARADGGGRSGAGTRQPVQPVRLSEPRPVEDPLPIPPPALAQPDAPALVGGAGQGATPGDGAASDPGPGSGRGDGAGAGDGPGDSGRGGAGAGWRPQWRRLPTRAELDRYFPPGAKLRGVSGGALLLCTVKVTGRVQNCRVLRETPDGEGFGEAAVNLSRYFRISPLRVRGRAVEAELRIPYLMTLERPRTGSRLRDRALRSPVRPEAND